ncbi:MAG: hypothetical protein J0L97_00890 [Alphaproteobacteria bacterium]|nr:hypothetical protein [Alphaproteobacteria bacterium]
MKSTSKTLKKSKQPKLTLILTGEVAQNAGKPHLDAGPPDYTFPAYLLSRD